MAADIRLAVQHAVRSADSPRRPTILRWLKAAVPVAAEITVRLVGEAEGRALNLQFRGKDYATNVLTFCYSDLPLAGDLVLCVPVVAREAAAGGRPLEAHYAHLVVHGALHLQGHDHQDDAEAAAMEALETRLLATLGYPDPYAGNAL